MNTKHSFFIMFLMSILIINLHSQNIIIEDELDNTAFQNEFNKSFPESIFEIKDSKILIWYDNFDRGGMTNEHIFRLMDKELKEIKRNVQTLPEKVYINGLFQLKNKNILAIIYKEVSNNSIELYCTQFNTNTLALETKNMNYIGLFEVKSRFGIRSLIRSGDLFRIISNETSNYLGVVSNASIIATENAKLNYHVLDADGKILKSGIYDFGVFKKYINIQNYLISNTGNIYTLAQDDTEDKWTAGKTFLVNLNNNTKVEFGKDFKALNLPGLSLSGSKIIILSTYSEDRKDALRGSAQGIFLGVLDDNTGKVIMEKSFKFSQETLDSLYMGNKRKSKTGNIYNGKILRLLKETSPDKFIFVLEDRNIIQSSNGRFSSTDYTSGSAICCQLSIKNAEVDWITAVNKYEFSTAYNYVGTFSYLDKAGELNLLMNVSKVRPVKATGQVMYWNVNLRKAVLTNLHITPTGVKSAVKLLNTKKDLGYYFVCTNTYQDVHSGNIYFILRNGKKELVAMIPR